jgi:hypothetical protein
MSEEKVLIETGVDQLIAYLKQHEQANIETLAKELNTTPKIIESWAEFLMEENIIGIDYKLTTPYIYLIKQDKKDIKDIKKEYELKNSNQDIHMKEYNWKRYIETSIDEHKNFFLKEARKRSLQNPEELWEEYKKKVTSI